VIARNGDGYMTQRLFLRLFLVIAAGFCVVSNASAGHGYLGLQSPAYVERVAVVGLGDYNSHRAGNIEIKIKDGFTLPEGVSCDTTYITTKKEVDSEKMMLSLLVTAQTTGSPVILHITDDSAYTAYPGRCSLIAVVLSK